MRPPNWGNVYPSAADYRSDNKRVDFVVEDAARATRIIRSRHNVQFVVHFRHGRVCTTPKSHQFRAVISYGNSVCDGWICRGGKDYVREAALE